MVEGVRFRGRIEKYDRVLAGFCCAQEVGCKPLFVLKTDSCFWIELIIQPSKMSLVSLAQSIAKESYAGKTTLLWVMNQIDMDKFVERVSQAKYCTDIETKCVLLEYNYTPWSDVEKGVEDMSDRLPGTDQLVHAALCAPNFRSLAIQYITGYDWRGNIYVRRKIDNDTKKPNPHRMQLVLVFSKVVPEPLDESSVDSNY